MARVRKQKAPSMTTTQRLARLRQLAADADANIYERIELAKAVCADDDWLIKNFDGDEGDAREFLQDEYFRQLAGWIKIDMLFKLHTEISFDEWQEYHFDLKSIESLWLDRQKGKPTEQAPPQRMDWRSKAKALEMEKDALSHKVSTLIKTHEGLEATVKQLQKENEELRQENAELRGQVKELRLRVQEQRLERAHA